MIVIDLISSTRQTQRRSQMANNNTEDPTQVKPACYWIKDSKGYGSVTVTLIFVSFWVTTLAYVLSIFEKLGPLQIRPFDVAACSAYFIPICTLYFGRRWTDSKIPRGNSTTATGTPDAPGSLTCQHE